MSSQISVTLIKGALEIVQFKLKSELHVFNCFSINILAHTQQHMKIEHDVKVSDIYHKPLSTDVRNLFTEFQCDTNIESPR